MLVVVCASAGAPTDPAEMRLGYLKEMHAPLVRYVSGKRYDLTPLLSWMALTPEVQRFHRRPEALAQWMVIRGGPEYRTNGWAIWSQPAISRYGPRQWVAVRNWPGERSFGVEMLVYRLDTSMAFRIGEGVINAVAYDRGASNAPPVLRIKP